MAKTKKHEHVLEIGTVKKSAFDMVYKYGNTSGIKLEVAPNGIRITASLGRKYTKEEILGYSSGFALFPDGVKKGMVAYLIKYDKPLEIKKVTVAVDGEVLETGDLGNDLVYSMIDQSFSHKFDHGNWKNEDVLRQIISFTKSNQDTRTAAIYALLMSKSKPYEAERFIYLWMAFNGFYIYKAQGQVTKDAEQIANIIKSYGLGEERVVAKKSQDIALQVINVLDKNWNNNPISKDSLEQGEHAELSEMIRKILEAAEITKLSTYGYLLCYFSYYFRCRLIHANKPVPLLSYAAEYEVRCLKLVNQMLDDFLEEELWKCFVSENV